MPMLSLQRPAGARIAVIFVILVLSGGRLGIAADAPSWPRFHGPKGDNISTETGLLERWPKEGLTLLWATAGIGQGYAGVTIAHDRIYTAGDVGGDLVIFALDMDGRIQWQVRMGRLGRIGPGGGGEHPRSTAIGCTTRTPMTRSFVWMPRLAVRSGR